LFHATPPPDAAALKYFLVSPKVTVCELAVNVVSVPKTASTVGDP
jgi:hypothetical protein